MLKVCGVPLDKLKFVRGTEYQLGEKYTLDMYKMAASVTTEHTLKVCFVYFSVPVLLLTRHWGFHFSGRC